jgi:opacity protein-like surface antigen
MSYRLFASAIALAAVTATTAHAQAASSAAKPISFGIAAGATIPTSDLSDIESTGYNVLGTVGFATPTLPVSFRLDAAYNQLSGKSISGVDLPDAKIWSFTGNVVYSVPLQQSVRPYLLGGLGLYNSKAGSGDSSTDFGFNVGGGITIPLSGFNTFVEARYNRVSVDGGSLQFVPITVGVMF